MSAESSLAFGSFLAARAFAAIIISLIGGFFVKRFSKSLPYSSSYLVFLWAFSRAIMLAIALLGASDYAQLYVTEIVYGTQVVAVARMIAGSILFFLTPYLINLDLRRYGIIENGSFGVGGKAMVSTVGSSVVILIFLYFLAKLAGT